MKKIITYILVVIFVFLTRFYIKDIVLYFNYLIKKPFYYIVEYKELKNNSNIDNNYLLKEYELENKKLKELLELDSSNYNYKNAKIISKNIYNFTIDKGINDGIKKDYILINNNGLVGKVIDVYKNTSLIEPVINFSNKISVVVLDDKEYYGLLSYDSKINKFIVEGTNVSHTNLPVITSGMNDNIKKGLLIGYVSNIESIEYGLLNKLYVNPSVDFNNLEYLRIIWD